MRERTPLPGTLINKLPNLKLVITSGMWNASVDAETLKEKNIIYCGTETKIHSTAELAWALNNEFMERIADRNSKYERW